MACGGHVSSGRLTQAGSGTPFGVQTDQATRANAGGAQIARLTVDQMLEDSRRRLVRISARDALHTMRGGTCLIDIRSDTQIAREGAIHGAWVVDRNVLEWRATEVIGGFLAWRSAGLPVLAPSRPG